jgi:hypothetical protein
MPGTRPRGRPGRSGRPRGLAWMLYSSCGKALSLNRSRLCWVDVESRRPTFPSRCGHSAADSVVWRPGMLTPRPGHRDMGTLPWIVEERSPRCQEANPYRTVAKGTAKAPHGPARSTVDLLSSTGSLDVQPDAYAGLSSRRGKTGASRATPPRACPLWTRVSRRSRCMEGTPRRAQRPTGARRRIGGYLLT